MTGTRREPSKTLRLLWIAALPFGVVVAAEAVAPPVVIDHDDDYVYRLPYGTDIEYAVLQTYGSRFSHTGTEFYTIDFAMPEGSLVHAAREGVVVRVDVGSSRGCFVEGCEVFANNIVIEHSDGTMGEYFHLQKGGALVAVGQFVMRGQPIALSGNTGYSSLPHLHFGVYAADAADHPHSIEVRFATTAGLMSRLRAGRCYRNVIVDRFAGR